MWSSHLMTNDIEFVQGIISSIKPLLSKIKQTNFRISDEIELQALHEANE